MRRKGSVQLRSVRSQAANEETAFTLRWYSRSEMGRFFEMSMKGRFSSGKICFLPAMAGAVSKA